jgi:hypothetical protein
MLAVCGSPAVGIGAESGAQGLGHQGGVRVAVEEGLLWRRGRWPAFGREGAPPGLLVPLLHVKKTIVSQSAPESRIVLAVIRAHAPIPILVDTRMPTVRLTVEMDTVVLYRTAQQPIVHTTHAEFTLRHFSRDQEIIKSSCLQHTVRTLHAPGCQRLVLISKIHSLQRPRSMQEDAPNSVQK